MLQCYIQASLLGQGDVTTVEEASRPSLAAVWRFESRRFGCRVIRPVEDDPAVGAIPW